MPRPRCGCASWRRTCPRLRASGRGLGHVVVDMRKPCKYLWCLQGFSALCGGEHGVYCLPLRCAASAAAAAAAFCAAGTAPWALGGGVAGTLVGGRLSLTLVLPPPQPAVAAARQRPIVKNAQSRSMKFPCGFLRASKYIRLHQTRKRLLNDVQRSSRQKEAFSGFMRECALHLACPSRYTMPPPPKCRAHSSTKLPVTFAAPPESITPPHEPE